MTAAKALLSKMPNATLHTDEAARGLCVSAPARYIDSSRPDRMAILHHIAAEIPTSSAIADALNTIGKRAEGYDWTTDVVSPDKSPEEVVSTHALPSSSWSLSDPAPSIPQLGLHLTTQEFFLRPETPFLGPTKNKHFDFPRLGPNLGVGPGANFFLQLLSSTTRLQAILERHVKSLNTRVIAADNVVGSPDQPDSIIFVRALTEVFPAEFVSSAFHFIRFHFASVPRPLTIRGPSRSPPLSQSEPDIAAINDIWDSYKTRILSVEATKKDAAAALQDVKHFVSSFVTLVSSTLTECVLFSERGAGCHPGQPGHLLCRQSPSFLSPVHCNLSLHAPFFPPPQRYRYVVSTPHQPASDIIHSVVPPIPGKPPGPVVSPLFPFASKWEGNTLEQIHP